MRHLRANLLLLAFTFVLCSVIYPALLYFVGLTVFPTAATGSLVAETGPDGKPVVRGSHLIAQKFTDPAYFWPRPSAADYNGTASGASNYSASNPKLRDRVAQQLGPMVVYRKDSPSIGPDHGNYRTPQKDLEEWFAAQPHRVVEWANEFKTAAENWAKTDFANDQYGLPGKFILSWADQHPEVREAWRKDNSESMAEPKPEDLVANFFASYSNARPGTWPGIVEVEQPDKTRVKEIQPVKSDSEIADGTPGICANLFELWLRDPANRARVLDLEHVPADMVMASGSGLDPHITVRNALSSYQLDRVAAKRTPPGRKIHETSEQIAALVRKLSFTPLSGLIGEPLVNAFDLNRELDAKFPVPVARTP
jgi:K+-transporting ATPase ATPase C chain